MVKKSKMLVILKGLKSKIFVWVAILCKDQVFNN